MIEINFIFLICNSQARTPAFLYFDYNIGFNKNLMLWLDLYVLANSQARTPTILYYDHIIGFNKNLMLWLD